MLIAENAEKSKNIFCITPTGRNILTTILFSLFSMKIRIRICIFYKNVYYTCCFIIRLSHYPYILHMLLCH